MRLQICQLTQIGSHDVYVLIQRVGLVANSLLSGRPTQAVRSIFDKSEILSIYSSRLTDKKIFRLKTS